MAQDAPSIRQLPLAYDRGESETSARAIIFELYPHWKTDPGDVVIHRFTKGIMNALFKLIKQVPGAPESENEKDAVLLRAYGLDSSILINREMELRTHALLAERGLASPLLARFQNGLLYKFLPGRVCTAEDLTKEHIWRAVAARLGEWHARIPLPQSKADGSTLPFRTVWTVIQEWVSALPTKTDEEKDRKQILESEFQKCFLELNPSGFEDCSNYVLGHCDLLSANIIIPCSEPSLEKDDESGPARRVHFIDYEYAVPCPPAFDLANHFSEWGGYDCDYNMLPTRTTRRQFVEQYLESYNRHQPAGSRGTFSVDQLCRNIDRYRGMPGFYWALFSLIQIEISDVEFDFHGFVQSKPAEFWAWRREVVGTRAQSGEEIPFRERRWAFE